MTSYRIRTGALLAGLVMATSSADARSGATGDICERLRADLAMVASTRNGSDLDRRIGDVARRLDDLGTRLERQGCGGSIIVIRGSEGDICGALEDEHQRVAARLYALLDQRGGRIGSEPQTLRTALADYGCLAGDQYAAGYSQFRSSGGAAIIDVLPAEAEIQPATLSIEPEPQQLAPAASESRKVEPVEIRQEPREVISLEERLENRDVRVVGPKFLPDRSEAIDLRSPAQTFFQ